MTTWQTEPTGQTIMCQLLNLIPVHHPYFLVESHVTGGLLPAPQKYFTVPQKYSVIEQRCLNMLVFGTK